MAGGWGRGRAGKIGGGPTPLFNLIRVGWLRAGHARPLQKDTTAFVGAGHAPPAVDE